MDGIFLYLLMWCWLQNALMLLWDCLLYEKIIDFWRNLSDELLGCILDSKAFCAAEMGRSSLSNRNDSGKPSGWVACAWKCLSVQRRIRIIPWIYLSKCFSMSYSDDRSVNENIFDMHMRAQAAVWHGCSSGLGIGIKVHIKFIKPKFLSVIFEIQNVNG